MGSYLFYSSHSLANDPAPAPISIHINQLNIVGELPIPFAQTQEFLGSYANKDYDLAGLQAISKELEKRIRDVGFAFYRVVLPPQNIADGTVDLKIVSFTVDKIQVSETKFFNADNILSSLPLLKTGQSPNTQDLAQQIKVANHHPNKNVTVVFKQSGSVDNIDANIEVTETKPYQFALLANNTGSTGTGKTRVTAAFQHTNLWDKDHSVNLSYTTSPNHTSDVSQYGLSYSLPLYTDSSWLTAYYAYSDVRTGRVGFAGGDIDVSGSGEMYGLHYLQYLRPVGSYEHELDIGFDNRYFTNDADLIIGNVNLGDISPDIRSTPLTIAYKGNITFNDVYIGHHIVWSKNLGIGSRNDNEAYQDMAFSTGQTLKDNWDLFRYGIFANKTLQEWLLRVSLKGQYANESLISGEQFGLGGAYSVRGYNEREISSDIGNSISFEAYTPKWKNINLLAFYDYGEGKNHDPIPNVKDDWNIASIGLGLRWQWQSQIQTSIDLAHTLRDGSQTSSHQNNIHASIALFY